MASVDRLRQLCEILLHEVRPGTWVHETYVRGVRAYVFYRLEQSEVARRQAAEHFSLPDELPVFRFLLTLPLNVGVPVRSLAERERKVLGQLPPGSVRFQGGTVERLAAVPLRADLAVVSARSLSKRVMARAGRLCAYMTTGVWVRAPRVDSLRVLESQSLPAGVILEEREGDPRLLVAPRHLNVVAQTPSGWRCMEQIYRSLNTASATSDRSQSAHSLSAGVGSNTWGPRKAFSSS